MLGELRVLRDGVPVDLGPAKQRAVLAVLLVNAGRAVPTHQIVDAVWGDEPPENGANVVQKHIAGLRRVLDPDRAPRTPGELVALTPAGYVLRLDGHTVDAHEFTEAATRAPTAELVRAGLGLWRGEALAGLTGPFFDSARARLAEGHATAWERWAELELGRGRDAALVPELARLVEQFPLREGLRAHLMIALSRSGRQAEALAAFRSARDYLVEQFGTEPGELLQETHRRVLRGDQAPLMPAAPAPAYVVDDGPPVRLRIPYVEVLFAVLTPLVTFATGAWIYFVYAAVHHHARRLFAAAGVYAGLLVIAFVFMAVDPSPLDDGDAVSGAEAAGISIWFGTALLAAIHGAIIATHQAGVAALAAVAQRSARGGGR
ncbi:AfsR/SARP family transcriptional regulator [Actinoplanes sp. LDG1-01]|uniref:AfsR/SARP family transcriptional regulator n=2 Tax=Paractinoplanes lichenicola TaxID=2802976 RepID=A0ABS1W153_9ACTN|nr:AfsR/SARP family transcriptional regulator [Actinoplanes lichenicola]